ncbi:metalloregulator ArsR/SmtB family transcription factor [Ornithinimicrobium sp. Arc0846-15]|nr:metalloregulator ArsR/SmtB family transcription factor [Ornithinimicrobium laminariae]
MIDAWQAAAEPSRRRLLHLLAPGEKSAGELSEAFESTRSAISQHLGVLRAAGLVDVAVSGRRRMYRLNPRGMVRLRAEITSFWTQELDDLAAEARSTTKGNVDERNEDVG